MNALSNWLASVVILIFTTLLSACTTSAPSGGTRLDRAVALAAIRGWQENSLPGEWFTLTAFMPDSPAPADTVAIYFEGDGLAWRTPDRASDDPTPVEPVGLELALAHPYAAAAYVARPCQYRPTPDERSCKPAYWTNRRYTPETVVDASHAIDLIKQRFHARRVILLGYSGGGTMAALAAARRQDVAVLITVAANLDLATWIRIHHLPPLSMEGSLNPADDWAALSNVRQVHFSGAQDEVAPSAVARAFQQHFPSTHAPLIVEMPGFDHVCCWVTHWPELIRSVLPESSMSQDSSNTQYSILNTKSLIDR